MFNLRCCHGQLVPFPVATCRPLTSLAARRAELEAATILLPLETRKVARGNAARFRAHGYAPRSCAPTRACSQTITKPPSRLTKLIIEVKGYHKIIVSDA